MRDRHRSRQSGSNSDSIELRHLIGCLPETVDAEFEKRSWRRQGAPQPEGTERNIERHRDSRRVRVNLSLPHTDHATGTETIGTGFRRKDPGAAERTSHVG